MQRIVLMTSEERRHRWLAAELARSAELVGVVSESKPQGNKGAAGIEAFAAYFSERDSREQHWFREAPTEYAELGCAVRRVESGGANSVATHAFVTALAPDSIYLFGTSIIRDPLLNDYAGRIVNMHLGLSPYYRGSATNYWPLVDGLPECVGVTVHHATLAVDGGSIIAQARPQASAADDSHDLGCRAIRAGAQLLTRLTGSALPLPRGVSQTAGGKLCRRGDFGLDSLQRLQRNFESGMMTRYIAEKPSRDSRYPIVAALTNSQTMS